ncbi:hypothetical protein I315_03852 [Cryptococcus gattii Ru294]|nr:hypothetical protein I315_03852 [Cryptococcus gattii Ru294]
MASSRKSRWAKQRAKIKARKAEEKRKEQTPSLASALPNSAITEFEEIVESKLCDLAVELNAMPGLTEEVPPTTDKHSRKRILKVGEIETDVMESMALQLRISDQQHSILSEKPSITFRDVLAPSGPPEDKKQTKVGRSRRGGKSARKRATLQSQGRNDRDTRRGTEADSLSVSSGATTGTNLCRISEKEKSHEIHDGDGRSQTIPLAPEEPSSSIISASDAHSSIDSFLSDPKNFMIVKENKLRLWQALCIEFGLVTLEGEGLPDLPVVSTPNNSLSDGVVLTLPKTLNQAKSILKTHAHVNLIDYLEARGIGAPEYVGAYKGLLHSSESALRKYTLKQRKFAPKDLAKAEWLNPLMRDLLHNRRKNDK